jgi:hypothetical protein
MDRLILRGAILTWILRSEDLLPGFFPISPKWRFVLFGLTTISFARHPEGLIEAGKRRWYGRIERWSSRRGSPDDDAPAPEQVPTMEATR